MKSQTVTFDELFARFNWKPIRNCPGRYTLAGGASKQTMTEILGVDLPIFEYQTETAADTVLVAEFENGGLISDRKNEGSFPHTLNDASGSARKLAQLGIKTKERN